MFGQAGSGIWEVSANGGELRLLVEAKNGAMYHGPQKLPDGNALLVTFKQDYPWNESTIVVNRLDTGERKTLIQGGSDARYLPTGHLVYVVESTLFAVLFDLGKLEVTGGPIPVIEGVMRSAATTGTAQFSFSKDGTLAFAPGIGRSDQHLLWIERSGQASQLTDKTGIFSTPRLSPDGETSCSHSR